MWSSLVTALLLTSGAAPEVETETGPVPADALRGYAALLERHVEDGRVDYRALEKTSLNELERFLSAVAKADLPKKRGPRIALLVDAYNAIVLRSVIAHGRPRSVLDVKGFFKEEEHRVAGRSLTLDALEKEVLNPFAKDPRTHFVLVCGAVGCPVLEDRPFLGSDVEARMEGAARRYLKSPTGARVRAGQLALSKIFDWYAADFGGRDGVLAFVRPRLTASARKILGPDVPEVTFFEYDWALNQQ